MFHKKKDKTKDEDASLSPEISSTEIARPTTPEDLDHLESKSVVGAQPLDPSANKKSKKRFHLPRPEQFIPPFIRKHLGKAARPIGIFLVVVVVCLIGFGTWALTSKSVPKANLGISRFKSQITIFKVVSTDPAENASNVSPQTPITIQFSEPVNPQKLQGNLFTTPSVEGEFTQGKTSSQVIFTPKVPFSEATKVRVMLNGTFQSSQGTQLGADYMYGFTTALPTDGVSFEDSNGLLAVLDSLSTSQKETYSLQFGTSVSSTVNVSLYKSDMNTLLSSLVYANQTTNGYTYPSFSNLSVDTSAMQLVSTQNGLSNNSNYSVTENNGIYVAIATDATTGKQLGNVWLDYSDFGVLVRQDDQQMVLDAQNLTTDKDVSATVQMYSLLNSVNPLNQATVDGITTVSTPYSPSVDVVVASDGTSQAIVPVSVLESQGDIRVDQNLSTAQTIFGVTDKPTYSTTDTIKYSGYERANDDAVYGAPNTSTLNLYIAQDQYGSPVATFTAQVNSDGTFSGTVPVSASWLSGDSSDQFQIYATSPDGVASNNVEVASFVVTSQPGSSSNVAVSFSKTSYLPTDSVQATIKATDSSGNPIPNAVVTVHTFSEDYYENNPTANLSDLDNVGNEITGSPTTLQLNSQGVGTETVNVANLPNDGNSQLVTVQANVNNATGAGAAGGASVVVHQGNGILSFAPSPVTVSSQTPLIGRVYATDLNGNPLSNTQVNYTLIDNSNSGATVSSGSATTNNTGLSQISVSIPSSIANGDNLELEASMTDAAGNKITADNYYSVTNDIVTSDSDTSGAVLEQLDVSGAPDNLKVGQLVNLTINSPSTLNAMVTMDRGRIYNAQMLQLEQGNNSFSFTVGANLAPSFTLTFNYFENGVYHSEGVQYTVQNPAQQATIQISSPDGNTVTANTASTIKINATYSNDNPLTTTLLVDIVNSSAYNLYAQTVPDMYTSLYPTLPLMTSSSSSLSSVGSGGGGRCGGGGGGPNSFTNPLATTLLWQPDLTTDANGNASVTFTPPAGSWTITVYSMDSNTVVGSATSTITAQ